MNRQIAARSVRGIVGSITVLVAGLSIRSAEPHDASQFQGGLDPSVVVVESGGNWKHDGRVGTFRVVVTKICSPEHCFDRLYLQWLERKTPKRESGEVVEAKTVLVPEVGDLTVVRSVRYLLASDENMFQIEAANTYTEVPGSLCLAAQTIPGRYQIREGKCE